MSQGNEWAVNESQGFPPGTVFSIPRYQRGYRWTGEEVTALLDDLEEFGKSDECVYCLQPLVVQAMEDGKINVVDGQQRLTTLAIILRVLGMGLGWDIEYTAEGGKRLSELLKEPGRSINDRFRQEAQQTVETWLDKAPGLQETPGGSINDRFRQEAQQTVETWLGKGTGRVDTLSGVLQGEKGKRVVFLRYDLPPEEDGHDAFKRLNAGKTPLTSAELVRALFMEAGNGLSEGEKADIAKEWDGIETALEDAEFWAIWPAERFKDVPTRLDFLFSVVAKVSGDAARQDPQAVYRAVELRAKMVGLQAVWEEVLRCWWWMQSCFADDEVFHLLGWLALFSDREARGLWELWQKAGCRMEAFKTALGQVVAEKIGTRDFDSFRYDSANPNELRSLFVLLNALEAQRRHIRFRFDLYRKGHWDIEHIASQTDNPLSRKEEQEEWLVLAQQEMSDNDKKALEALPTFCEKWKTVIHLFGESDDDVADKDGIGNLALLDAGTNRAYKNAIFPAKRRTILEKSLEKDGYVPPATEAVFAKLYSPAAAQMRYWGRTDAEAYRATMKTMFDQFMEKAK